MAAEIKKHAETFVFAGFLLALLFLFDSQTPWAAFLSVSACAGIYFFYIKNTGMETDTAGSKTLLYISFIFIALKFFRIFSFPADFFGDESTYIVAPHMLINKTAGAFDYNTRYGISLPYMCTWLTAAVMKLVTWRLDLLRLIPVLVFCGASFGLWKLAGLMKMPDKAPAFLFVFALSSWAWKLAKLYLPNFYIPLFIVFFLVLFYYAVNRGSLAALAGSALVFAGGFFTYGTWILMAPFAVYLALEYRKELGGKKLAWFLAFILASALAAAAIYLSSQHLFGTLASRTIFPSGAGLQDTVSAGFTNLYKFFLSSVDTDMSFMKAPFFYAIEIMLLVFGLIHICLNIKTREYRIILAGFIISLPVILFGASIAHPVRHAVTFTFACLICGIGLAAAAGNKKFFFLLVPVYVFSAVSFMLVYYFVWGSSMPQNMMDRRIAAYINTTYGNKALYVNDTEPFGRYMAFLRTKTAYRNSNDADFEYAVFTTPVLWHKSLKDAFPEIGVKYFFENGSEAALWSLPVNQEARQYFMDMSQNLASVDSLMWKEDYDAALDSIKNKINFTGARYSVLQNTFLKVHASTVYVKKKDLRLLAECMINTPYPVLELAPDYYFGGVVFETQRKYSEAYNYYGRASRLAPEWTAPKAKMQLMKYLSEKKSQ